MLRKRCRDVYKRQVLRRSMYNCAFCACIPSMSSGWKAAPYLVSLEVFVDNRDVFSAQVFIECERYKIMRSEKIKILRAASV